MSTEAKFASSFHTSHPIAFLLLHTISFFSLFSFYAWVVILFSQSPKPGPYVKEMNDAATFYTNRVLKDYKHRYVTSLMSFSVHLLFDMCS